MFSLNSRTAFILLLLASQWDVVTNRLTFTKCSAEDSYLYSVNDMFDKGQHTPGDSGATELYPCWFDLNLARTGQAFARKHFGTIFLSHIYSLTLLLADQQTRRVLVLTKRSNNPEKAYKRYLATAQHVYLWYNEDILSPAWMQSVQTIRRIHQSVQTFTNRLNATTVHRSTISPWQNPPDFTLNNNLWSAFDQDLQPFKHNPSMRRNYLSPNYPFNQFTMVITLWAFMGLTVVTPHEIGISQYTESELQGFAHLWTVIAYGLGMHENFILCKDISQWKKCKQDLHDIYRNYVISQFLELDFEGKVMIESLLKAVNEIIPPYPVNLLLINLLEKVLGVRAVHLRRRRSSPQRVFDGSLNGYLHIQRISRVARWFTNIVVIGELQLASKKVFGNPGTNASQVALTHFYV